MKGLSEQGSIRPSLRGNKAGLQKEDLVQGHLYIQELPVSSTVLEEVTSCSAKDRHTSLYSPAFSLGRLIFCCSPAHLRSVSIESNGSRDFTVGVVFRGQSCHLQVPLYNHCSPWAHIPN